MRAWISIGLSLVALAGCATSAPPIMQAPIPDVGTWVQPQPETIPTTAPLRPEREPSAAEKVHEYEDGGVVTVTVAVGDPLDIRLQPGEVIRNITHGDRSVLPPGDEQPPWDIKQGSSGEPERPHVFVTVTRPGLRTGLTVTTSKRVYVLTLRSVGQSKTRIVRWTYPSDMVRPVQVVRLLPDPLEPMRYYGGYTISTPAPVWAPTQVLNDGRKTYLIFPHAKRAIDAPLFRIVGASGAEVTNVRDLGRVYVVDHLFHQAELRIGAGETAEVVTIVRGAPEVIDCPHDSRCPLWPPETALTMQR